ncbi:tRNA (adenosine(37)-N6)-threonylcarbamoyltransferase complex dimerization subunit type 1 TsaB [Peptococcus simiae]|uniref:tRNA (Adenosine(37)-N6)-threonylcarbamoyltransferase complex dimerization subunit type 1 TsaB n=1 Tax=Peptococcus simiae TaxID=1643805 RepID=A0ABW9GXV1_9FIRM
MYILALDTSSITGSVAIWADGQVRAEIFLNTGLTHSEQAMPMVDRALGLTGADIGTIDAIAVTSGPGSFTGLRIGLATAKALAQGLGVPIATKTSLEVLASGQLPYVGYICPILNARRKEVYTAIYQAEGDGMIRVAGPQAISLAALLEEVGEDRVLFCGDGIDVYGAAIQAAMGDQAFFASGLNRYVRAGALAEILAPIFMAGQGQTYLDIEPFYLRQSEAVLNWEKRHPGESLYD